MSAEQRPAARHADDGSLVQVFRDRVAAMPTAVAARFKRGGAWSDITWRELSNRAHRVSAALLAAGVGRGDRVCLIGDTQVDWVIMDIGIQSVGAVSVPIYQSNLPTECQYIADNCGAELLLVDSAAHAAKFARVKSDLPKVRNVIQYLGTVGDSCGDWVRSIESCWAGADAIMKANPNAVDEAASKVTAADLSTIIYTSGTTGPPKGVMLTHDAFVFTAGAVESIGLIQPGDTQLFFLPLAHSFAQVLKAVWFRIGHVMAFAESLERLIDNMGEVRPTVMAGVPRIFEKAYNKVVTDGSAAPGVAGLLFRMTLAEADRYGHALDAGQEYRSIALSIGKRLVLPRVREKLSKRFGGRLRFFVSGGAPLARSIAYFFDLAGIQILEGFGLTETCAATCVNRPSKNKIGSVGAPIPGMEVKTAADGEILIRGRAVMKGYIGNAEATAEVFDRDGWFHSGDIGELDSDGYLKITDRKKDIIVTAGGKNVAPQNLENALKVNAIISQVVVHGDRRNYLCALITIAEERARKVTADRGLPFTDYAALSRLSEIRAEVQAAVDRLNATLPSYETIKRFEILPRDFSQETGELTPTLKVKRKLCNERYKAILDGMYAPDSNPPPPSRPERQ